MQTLGWLVHFMVEWQTLLNRQAGDHFQEPPLSASSRCGHSWMLQCIKSSQLHQGKMTMWNCIPLLKGRLVCALIPNKGGNSWDHVISPVCGLHTCNADRWRRSGLAALVCSSCCQFCPVAP